MASYEAENQGQVQQQFGGQPSYYGTQFRTATIGATAWGGQQQTGPQIQSQQQNVPASYQVGGGQVQYRVLGSQNLPATYQQSSPKLPQQYSNAPVRFTQGTYGGYVPAGQTYTSGQYQYGGVQQQTVGQQQPQNKGGEQQTQQQPQQQWGVQRAPLTSLQNGWQDVQAPSQGMVKLPPTYIPLGAGYGFGGQNFGSTNFAASPSKPPTQVQTTEKSSGLTSAFGWGGSQQQQPQAAQNGLNQYGRVALAPAQQSTGLDFTSLC